jgi:radical SAM protein with 4Fe4S-binding SPASM domain
MPFPLFRKLLADLKGMGTSSLYFIGEGESLLHDGILDFIALAKQSGLRVTLLSNALLLDETMAKGLIEARLDILQVSCWASTPEEYAANTPGTDIKNFDQLVKNLTYLAHLKARHHATKPMVVLHRPLSRRNFRDFDAMVQLAQRLGCDRVSFGALNSPKGELSEISLSPAEEREVCQALEQLHRREKSLFPRRSLKQILERYQTGEAVWEKIPCHVGWYHTRIKPDGTVIPCHRCDLVMGHLREQSLPEIWNGPAYRAFRRRTSTTAGLAALQASCDCGFCCFTDHNLRVHRYLSWLPAPWRRA